MLSSSQYSMLKLYMRNSPQKLSITVAYCETLFLKKKVILESLVRLPSLADKDLTICKMQILQTVLKIHSKMHTDFYR